MIRKNVIYMISPLLASAMLLTGCGSAAAAASDPASISEAAAGETRESAVTTAAEEAAAKDIEETAAADTEETAPAEAENTPAQPDLSSMSGQEVYDHLYGDLIDLYAMETYDEVPEYLSEWHDNVDYGTIEEDVEYYSTTAGDYKYCNVLLPAGYDASQEYPVLYMYHGFGGRYDSHVHDHSILQTLYGNMLSEGLTVPMIIVGADMYTDILAEKEDKSDAEMRPCYDKGVEDIAQDLMPFIESRYPVKTGRMNTAVTGVSQGATTALAIAYRWPDKIAYVGSFAPCSGVIPTPFAKGTFWNTPILEDFTIEPPEMMLRYIYLTVGTEDPWCIKSTQYYGEVMDAKGIPNQNDLVEGYDHGNDLWELGHYNFLQKIFLD